MKKIIFPLLALALASVACRLPAASPPPTEAVQNLATLTPTALVAPAALSTPEPASTLPAATAASTLPPPATEAAPAVPPPAVAPARMFLHVAEAGNTFGNYTLIDDSQLNGNPNAQIYVTANWNPGGEGGTYNNASIGIWYDTDSGQWSIFNQDLSDMPAGAAFNILVPNPGTASTFVHAANSGNSTLWYTYIDNPLTNNNPGAQLQVAQNWNPGGGGGTYNNAMIGVWYDTDANQWSIFNQDRSTPIPVGAAFNILLPSGDMQAFVHTATSANSFGNYTLIDNLLTNNNPNALLQVTANWNPGGGEGVYDNAALGVWYDTDTGQWSIYNQDISPMPEGAAFNVIVFIP